MRDAVKDDMEEKMMEVLISNPVTIVRFIPATTEG
jgi:hypothetical protein